MRRKWVLPALLFLLFVFVVGGGLLYWRVHRVENGRVKLSDGLNPGSRRVLPVGRGYPDLLIRDEGDNPVFEHDTGGSTRLVTVSPLFVKKYEVMSEDLAYLTVSANSKGNDVVVIPIAVGLLFDNGEVESVSEIEFSEGEVIRVVFERVVNGSVSAKSMRWWRCRHVKIGSCDYVVSTAGYGGDPVDDFESYFLKMIGESGSVDLGKAYPLKIYRNVL